MEIFCLLFSAFGSVVISSLLLVMDELIFLEAEVSLPLIQLLEKHHCRSVMSINNKNNHWRSVAMNADQTSVHPKPEPGRATASKEVPARCLNLLIWVKAESGNFRLVFWL